LGATGEGALSAVEWTIADLQFDDVFALRFEAAGDGQDVESGFGGQAARELAQRDCSSHVSFCN
jgi:hypothetical protein